MTLPIPSHSPSAVTCPCGSGMELTDATVLCEPCWSQVPRNQKVVLFLRWVEWRAEPGDRAALRRLRRLIDDTITALPGR